LTWLNQIAPGQIDKKCKKGKTCMNLSGYLDRLVWTQTDLARNAGIAVQTAINAVEGKTVKRAIATKIASAISEALGEKVEVRDIDGLRISQLKWSKTEEKG